MAGGQLRTTGFGTTSEHLAEAFLSAFAFTTRVRRENDLGHDLHCVLHDFDVKARAGKAPASGVVSAGPPFNVQVKSDRKPISYEKPHARKWIGTQHSPFFICVVDRSALQFDLYSTWNLNNAIQMYGYGWDTDHVKKIDLVISGRDDPWSGFPDIADPELHDHVLAVPFGPAVLTAKMADVMNPATAREFAAVLGDWIAVERANIVRQAMRIHWVYGPDRWQPNTRLDANTPMTGEFFFNPRNLEPDPNDPHRPTVGENMVRAVFALIYGIERFRLANAALPAGLTPELERTIRDVYRHSGQLASEDKVFQAVLAKVERRYGLRLEPGADHKP